MSTGASHHQQMPPFSSLSMPMPPAEIAGIAKLSPRVKPISQREPWPKVISLEAQPISSATMGIAQIGSPRPQNHKASSGLQKSGSMNKRSRKVAEVTPVTPKAATLESLETVRLKMKESLASALELVINEGSSSKDASHWDGNFNESASNKEKKSEGAQSLDIRSEDVLLDHKSQCPMDTSMGSSSQKLVDASDKYPDCGMDEFTGNTDSNKWQVHQQTDPLLDDVSLNETNLMKDDFLQVNGLCWAPFVGCEETGKQEHHDIKRIRLSSGIDEDSNNKKSHILALEIEEELYKLFGGVNKKYKEKGRSLLFNLKDRHNPELRQRVFSGEISPERLCAMSAEELASKELSQWRIAKAEELAQMVVLPDMDVRYRMVKKTHKGEYQVEVENDDSSSVEVTVGTSLLPQFNAKSSGNDNKPLKAAKQKDSQFPSDSMSSKNLKLSNKQNSEQQLPLYNPDSAQPESTDPMQHVMVEDSKIVDPLPVVPSLDEFMQLASEPPFGSMTAQDPSLSDGKSLDSLSKHSPDVTSDFHLESCATTDKSEIKFEKGSSKKAIEGDAAFAISEDNLAFSPPIKESSNGDLMWEGLLQLNISSLVTALSFHKSGEQTSTKEWPSFLEIKGRVKLEAFEKFLQELRLSRNRAIMVMQFCWKEGSPESGRMKLCETVDSYIVDERVGFAEPVPGVELYFCPPHPRTTQVLISNLSKEHEEIIGKVDEGLIGVLIWKKEVSPRPPSQQRKHSRKHSHVRNPEDNPSSSKLTSSKPRVIPGPPEEEEIDDVPPGFGPAVAGDHDDDDLPEFSFAQDSSKAMVSRLGSLNRASVHAPIAPLSSSRPVEHLREMIHKYGSNGNESSWKDDDDDDDDDIPEWRPDLPLNTTHHRQVSYQHLQPNHYLHQTVNQLPLQPHSPMYPKTDAHLLPQHNKFAPGPWVGRGPSYGSGQSTGLQYPSAVGYGQNRMDWKPAYSSGRR